MKIIKVTSCKDCPFFHEDTDGWAQDCAYRDEFGEPAVDDYDAACAASEGIIPENCPLKDGVIVKINE